MAVNVIRGVEGEDSEFSYGSGRIEFLVADRIKKIAEARIVVLRHFMRKILLDMKELDKIKDMSSRKKLMGKDYSIAEAIVRRQAHAIFNNHFAVFSRYFVSSLMTDSFLASFVEMGLFGVPSSYDLVARIFEAGLKEVQEIIPSTLGNNIL
jgi:NACalpha-BTF3-like transcription factor